MLLDLTAFDFFDDGIIERHVTKTDRDSSWKTGTPTFFPTTSVLGSTNTGSVIFVVPIDDTHTWFLEHIANRPGAVAGSGDSHRFQEVSGVDPSGQFIIDTANGQDYMVAVTQGEVAHREHERLASSDVGIVLYRQLVSSQVERMEHGRDPINVHRLGSPNQIVELPHVAESSPSHQSARQLKRARHREHTLLNQSAASNTSEAAADGVGAMLASLHTSAQHYEVVLRPATPPAA